MVASGSATDPRRSPGIGATIAGITQDFVLGPLEQTGRALDLAIDGDGFFAVANPFSAEVSYTRNGNFRLTAVGELEDSYGNRLQAYPVDAAGNPTSTTAADVTIPVTNGTGASLANVTINNLLPERIDTERQRQMAELHSKMAGITLDEAYAAMAKTIAAGRLGRPEEFGDACAFLCSAQAGYMSGQNLQLDGGSYHGLI